MSLELIAPPTAEPITLAEMKAHLRVAHGDDDAAIAAFARAARRAVEARGALALLTQGWRLTLDRLPESAFSLPRAPVVSIDALAIVSRGGSAEVVDPDLYDVELGPHARIIVRGALPLTFRRIAGARIDFTAGWTVSDSVPEELKLAIKMLAAHFYENREGAAAERIFAVPQAVDALIAPYRQVRL
jgi:uncharacterized phiE125 gp8 family phage protein